MAEAETSRKFATQEKNLYKKYNDEQGVKHDNFLIIIHNNIYPFKDFTHGNTYFFINQG